MQQKDPTDFPSCPDFDMLFCYGEILDAADAGMSAISPRRYRTVARDAKRFIVAHWEHPLLPRECRRAWALQDLFENVQFEKRADRTVRRLAAVQLPPLNADSGGMPGMAA